MQLIQFEIKLLQKILNNLRPIDLIQIKSLNKYLYSIIKYNLEKRFKKSHIFNGFFTNEVYTLLNKKCVLSGSCLLQFLLDERYPEYDIDIFLDDRNYPKMINYLFKIGYRIVYAWNRNTYSEWDKYVQIMNFKKDNFKVQLILSNKVKSTPIDIVKNFDFDILKNYYDGSSLRILDKISIADKVTIVNLSESRGYKFVERIKKYKERGITFKIINGDIKRNFKPKIMKLIFNKFKVLTL